jgi:hypothetical protein
MIQQIVRIVVIVKDKKYVLRESVVKGNNVNVQINIQIHNNI